MHCENSLPEFQTRHPEGAADLPRSANIFLDIFLDSCREFLEDIFQVRGAACCLKQV